MQVPIATHLIATHLIPQELQMRYCIPTKTGKKWI